MVSAAISDSRSAGGLGRWFSGRSCKHDGCLDEAESVYKGRGGRRVVGGGIMRVVYESGVVGVRVLEWEWE